MVNRVYGQYQTMTGDYAVLFAGQEEMLLNYGVFRNNEKVACTMGKITISPEASSSL